MDLSDLYKRVNVTIGRNCDISPFCSLENVVLGDSVCIRDGVQLKNVVIGNRTKLGRCVTLYSSERERPVRLGKCCGISYGVFGEATGNTIEVGDHVVIAHSGTLLTSSGPGPLSPIMNQLYPIQVGAVILQNHVWVGAHCILLPGSRLPEGVVVGANSVVKSGSYDPWSVYGGSPAKLLKRLDREALGRARSRFGSSEIVGDWNSGGAMC